MSIHDNMAMIVIALVLNMHYKNRGGGPAGPQFSGRIIFSPV